MRMFITVALVAMVTGCSANRREDAAFTAMQERGKAVMGVDQYMSAHRFEDRPDGGIISLVSTPGDSADVRAIRQHMKSIATMFAKGDFTDPSMIHMGAVPGTDVMTQRLAMIRYDYSEVPRGALVTIVSSDSAALQAIHKFLAFQRDAHRTHEM